MELIRKRRGVNRCGSLVPYGTLIRLGDRPSNLKPIDESHVGCIKRFRHGYTMLYKLEATDSPSFYV